MTETDLPHSLVEAGARALADWLNVDYDRIGDGQKTLCHQAEAVISAATDHLDPEGLLAEVADYAEQHVQQREELNRYRTRLDEVVRERDALRARRDEVLAILDRFNTVPADDMIAEQLIDSARNLLAGGTR
jgi:hypothetical protein